MQTRALITIDTGAYVRTHGINPHTALPRKGMWYFVLDDDEKVTVKYGLYKEALAWAKAQATAMVKVLP